MSMIGRFTGKADIYVLARPSYSEELLKYLYKTQGFSADAVIADIGSGTGKFSKQLLERGSKVYCIEPNDDMRKKAESILKAYPNFVSVNATASFTGLDNSSVDFIAVAQAFHWFDVSEFRKECQRILKPQGKVVLVWNSRVEDSDINIEVGRVNSKYCPAFKGFNGGINENDDRIIAFFGNKYEFVEFENSVFYSRNDFISRCCSSSYAPLETDRNYGAYIEKLNEIFDKYQKNNSVVIPMRTVAYIGNPID